MKLLIFTQKVDKNDPVLGFFHDWILEFAKKCESVSVICLYEGQGDLPKNVQVFSLRKDLGSSRLSYLLNLYRYLRKLSGSYDQVFIHMNPIYLVLCGWYFKIKNIPAYLWYVHRSVDFKLRVATIFAKKVFTSTKESFRINTDKVFYLGHGVDVEKFPNSAQLYSGGKFLIAHIGRLTAIKNLDTLIQAISILKNKNFDIALFLIGGKAVSEDIEHQNQIDKIIKEKKLENVVNSVGEIPHALLGEFLVKNNINATVNLTPTGGMDKVVLESLLLGIPVFTSNTAFSNLFQGDRERFIFKYKDSENLAENIERFMENPKNVYELSSKVRRDFDLAALIEKIVSLMK